jgi:hypothetical protein
MFIRIATVVGLGGFAEFFEEVSVSVDVVFGFLWEEVASDATFLVY